MLQISKTTVWSLCLLGKEKQMTKPLDELSKKHSTETESGFSKEMNSALMQQFKVFNLKKSLIHITMQKNNNFNMNKEITLRVFNLEIQILKP